MELARGKVIVVERGSRKRQASGGVLKAMGVVWTHWQNSFRKNRQFDQIHGTFTQEYPDERPKLAEAYRNLPILLYDDASGQELCTSCFQCQRICPPQVIHMTQAKDPVTGKAIPAVAEFVIEYDACMSCGFCAEVCPFDAIKMDHEFELATDQSIALTLHKEQLNRPVSYYQGIAPTMWAEVQESAYKKLQATVKRRPGRTTDERKEAEAREGKRENAESPIVGTQQAASAPAAPATREATETTTDATPPATDKAAKLAAIRAANAAKKGGTQGAESPTVGTQHAASAPAAPASRETTETISDVAPPAASAPAAPASRENAETTSDVAPPAAPANDKAARLAAIRAANAAKKAAEERGE